MAEHAGGAGYLVNEVAGGGGLRRRKNFAALRLFGVARGSGSFALDLDHRGGDVTQQPNRDLAVQIHVLDKSGDVGVTSIDRKADKLWVPNAPLFATLIKLPLGIERI